MSQTFSQDNTKRFEFATRFSTPIGLILAELFLLILFSYIGYIRERYSVGYWIFILAMIPVMIFTFYFRAVLLASDLVIDDHGISRFLFFIRCRDLKWHDVKQIKTLRQMSPNTYKLSWFVYIYSYDRASGWDPSKPPVIFTDATSDREELALTLNHYIKQYWIKVFERVKIRGVNKK